MSAVRFMLDEEHSLTRRSPLARYICGRLSGYNVVIVTLSINAQGKVFTAVAACELRANFPNLVHFLLVGIGGGVPSQGTDVRLGDVVIGAPGDQHAGIVQYDLGKEQIDGFVRRGYLAPPPRDLLEILPLEMSTLESKFTSSVKKVQDRCLYPQFIRPPPEQDLLFESTYPHSPGNDSCECCDRCYVIPRSPRENDTMPTIHYGLIASGDRVIKNAIKRDELAREAGGAICFEMEAAGLMNDFPCLVIRGICDYCDSHKNDAWHEYAAVAAAAVAKEILELIHPGISPTKDPGTIVNIPRIEDTSANVQGDGPHLDAGLCPTVFSGTFNSGHGKQYNIGCVTGGSLFFG
ncbi:purine and uridine phosphorylase [Aspergillus heteromorphus CBS 117.55]|uniref:Purine and uridine phosphorylase n=1 Tax=Aspergillus heteromorphus CBS 117.55 TaxID=1448321 RepID=A0A317X0Z8_9EURO|nr:purine and uridine phosphorylase [Aspergillus heteromorphus CBS 117.55]PWY92266.1 purine and uridine phosphorylase [Aspergillus heteromorphus CBS 117.55]